MYNVSFKAMSRQNSARSTKSVAWSTTVEDAPLIEEGEQPKKKSLCARIVSGEWYIPTKQRVIFI